MFVKNEKPVTHNYAPLWVQTTDKWWLCQNFKLDVELFTVCGWMEVLHNQWKHAQMDMLELKKCRQNAWSSFAGPRLEVMEVHVEVENIKKTLWTCVGILIHPVLCIQSYTSLQGVII
jgi:hypothetical protein